MTEPSFVFRIPDHIDVDEPAGTASCAVCRTGVDIPVTFGPISGTNLLAAFVVQHATHTRKGAPSGLTAAGNATKAAIAVIRQREGEPT